MLVTNISIVEIRKERVLKSITLELEQEFKSQFTLHTILLN